jgi:hypothetical protein
MSAFLLVLLPQNGGQFGPHVIIGWPNRLFVVAYCAWLMLVAWRAIKLRFLAASEIRKGELKC